MPGSVPRSRRPLHRSLSAGCGGEASTTVFVEFAHPGEGVLWHPSLVREFIEPRERRLSRPQPRLGLLALLLAFCFRQAQAADEQRQAHPQWTNSENRASAASSSGSTFRTFLAASAGVWLAPRPLNFISSVLDTVITAVPATPANSPLPTFAAMSPMLVLIGCSFLAVCIYRS